MKRYFINIKHNLHECIRICIYEIKVTAGTKYFSQPSFAQELHKADYRSSSLAPRYR